MEAVVGISKWRWVIEWSIFFLLDATHCIISGDGKNLGNKIEQLKRSCPLDG